MSYQSFSKSDSSHNSILDRTGLMLSFSSSLSRQTLYSEFYEISACILYQYKRHRIYAGPLLNKLTSLGDLYLDIPFEIEDPIQHFGLNAGYQLYLLEKNKKLQLYFQYNFKKTFTNKDSTKTIIDDQIFFLRTDLFGGLFGYGVILNLNDRLSIYQASALGRRIMNIEMFDTSNNHTNYFPYLLYSLNISLGIGYNLN
ncbi:MAG: hypothetical protein IIA45_13935 [Bacteroidetes bacterium]|nr:hypothetical protein [Bacteroidota bacterium]